MQTARVWWHLATVSTLATRSVPNLNMDRRKLPLQLMGARFPWPFSHMSRRHAGTHACSGGRTTYAQSRARVRDCEHAADAVAAAPPRACRKRLLRPTTTARSACMHAVQLVCCCRSGGPCVVAQHSRRAWAHSAGTRCDMSACSACQQPSSRCDRARLSARWPLHRASKLVHQHCAGSRMWTQPLRPQSSSRQPPLSSRTLHAYALLSQSCWLPARVLASASALPMCHLGGHKACRQSRRQGLTLGTAASAAPAKSSAPAAALARLC